MAGLVLANRLRHQLDVTRSPGFVEPRLQRPVEPEQHEPTLARHSLNPVPCVPRGLASKPPGVEDWDDLTEDQKKVGARLMETYAGFATHTDEHTGRLIDALEDGDTRQHPDFLYRW